MPISTVLPPPLPQFESEYFWPSLYGNSFPNVAVRRVMSDGIMRPGHQTTPILNHPGTAPGPGLGLIANGTSVMAVRHERTCVRSECSVAGVEGGAVVVPGWQPTWEPAGNASGARANDPEGVVGTFDYHLSAEYAAGGAPGWPQDSSGVVFLPYASAPIIDVSNVTPAGGAASGGFGVLLNDVAGVGTWQYVSWAPGGAILERTTVPAFALADPTLWNTLRLIILSATAGRSASLELVANGVSILTREFGTPELLTPNQMAAALSVPRAGLLGPGLVAAGPDGDRLYSSVYFRFGRFTPGGVEVEAP